MTVFAKLRCLGSSGQISLGDRSDTAADLLLAAVPGPLVQLSAGQAKTLRQLGHLIAGPLGVLLVFQLKDGDLVIGETLASDFHGLFQLVAKSDIRIYFSLTDFLIGFPISSLQSLLIFIPIRAVGGLVRGTRIHLQWRWNRVTLDKLSILADVGALEGHLKRGRGLLWLFLTGSQLVICRIERANSIWCLLIRRSVRKTWLLASLRQRHLLDTKIHGRGHYDLRG